MMLYLVAFAYKALFVIFTHVFVQLLFAKEALSAKFTERMHAPLDLLLRYTAVVLWAIHRRNVARQLVRRIQGVFMTKDLFMSRTQLATWYSARKR